MKILLAAINARFTHSSLAIRYLRNALEQAGADNVRLREFWISQDRLAILRDLVLADPEVLMLSVQIWNSALVSGLLPDLRRLMPDCHLILGGPEVSWNAEAWLARHPQIDLIVQGAAELAMVDLVKRGFQLDGIAPNRVLHCPEPDFPSLEFPYRPEDFANLRDHYLYYESSRGCPFACAYCLSSRQDQAQCAKPFEQTIRELDLILQAKPMMVKFVDRTFNADPERSRRIWRYLIDHAPEGSGFHFEIHPALLENADFPVLAQARPGLFKFEIGVQSINPKPLAAIRRPVDWPAAAAQIKAVQALGNIHIHLDLIAGLPFEGMAEIGQSFDAIMGLEPDHFQLGFLKGLPGTDLGDQAGQNGLVFSGQPPYQILRSDWLSLAELAELDVIEQLVENIANPHRLDHEMRQAVRHFASSFAAYRDLARFSRQTGFDIRTRQVDKVAELLRAWKNSWPESGLTADKPGTTLD